MIRDLLKKITNKEAWQGAFKSNTMQVNAGFLGWWAWLYESGTLQANPEIAFWSGIANAILNKLLRAKTKKPLAER